MGTFEPQWGPESRKRSPSKEVPIGPKFGHFNPDLFYFGLLLPFPLTIKNYWGGSANPHLRPWWGPGPPNGDPYGNTALRAALGQQSPNSTHFMKTSFFFSQKFLSFPKFQFQIKAIFSILGAVCSLYFRIFLF